MSKIDKTKVVTTIISGFFGLLTSTIPIFINNLTARKALVVYNDVPVLESPIRLESPIERFNNPMPRSRTLETVEVLVVENDLITPTNVIIVVSAVGIAIVLGLTILKRIRRKK